MSDDLVKRVRRVEDDALYNGLFGAMSVIHEAADRIEAQAARIRELEADKAHLAAQVAAYDEMAKEQAKQGGPIALLRLRKRAESAQKDAEEWARKCALADHRAQAAEAERDAIRSEALDWRAQVGELSDKVKALTARIRELEAAQGVGRITVTDEMQDRFADWFRQNYPGPDTIIHKPDWHAPKIFRAALQCIPRSAFPPADAIAAREARDKRVRESALREAIVAINEVTCRRSSDYNPEQDAILALIKEGQYQ